MAVGVVAAIIVSGSIVTTLLFSSTEDDYINGHIIAPIISFHPSHNLGEYKLSVVNIHFEMVDDRFVDINNVTYLITDYIPHPHVYGGPEPAKSILNDEDNKSNLASGRVIEIKNNLNGDVTFYDHDDNDLITVGDEFIINADIVPVGSINGVDFYLIFDAEYYGDKPIFEVMGGIFIGEYTERVQLTIEKVDGVFNVTIVDIDELYFQDQTISNLSVRIYSKITNSTLFWQNLNDTLENESSLDRPSENPIGFSR